MNSLQSLIISTLQFGPIPQHIAFIMDGNRRFAQKNSLERIKGHELGFAQLERILELCSKIKIKCVSIYAFSIHNFNRKKEEVDSLMALATDKFNTFSQRGSLVERLGIRIRVSGALHLLPETVKNAAIQAIEATKNHDLATLNICFPYTSRNEIAHSISTIINEYQTGSIQLEDINMELIQKHLFTGDLPPLEVLVRTSGEIRLSDFMLWQASEDCFFYFTSVLWPEFGFYEMLKVITSFQLFQSQRLNHSNRAIQDKDKHE